MKKRILYVILCVPLLTFGGNPPAPGLEDPSSVPIDQMKYILLTAGFFFGIYTIKKVKKKNYKIFKHDKRKL